MTRFIDANVIIKAFTSNSEQEKCKKLLRENFITNTLCLIEAHDGISTIKQDKILATICIKKLFTGPGIIIELDKNILYNSFKRIGKYSLHLFDLIHYTTALTQNCTEFCSYDQHFDGLEIKRVEP
jgi:predicted nucleic acid-binding protein